MVHTSAHLAFQVFLIFHEEKNSCNFWRATNTSEDAGHRGRTHFHRLLHVRSRGIGWTGRAKEVRSSFLGVFCFFRLVNVLVVAVTWS